MSVEVQKELPLCPICCDTLGKYGGPATLPCGHNGCLACLATVQERNPQCPLCRAPFESDYSLVCNHELRDLISLATSVHMDDKTKQDGWEAFPTSQMTCNHYAKEFKQTHLPGFDMEEPSAPSMEDYENLDSAQSAVGDPDLLLLEPPQWLPDSYATSCCSCHQPFKPLTRLRHHCRMCGKIFCHACCNKRMLLPPKYQQKDPQRVCEMCVMLLEPLQGYIAGNWSRAVQAPIHDCPDSIALRSWINSPYCTTLEEDIFKTANILRSFVQAQRLPAERNMGLPTSVLQGARGLAIIGAVKVGAGWSATFGTGLLVSRQPDGEWSAPCAIASGGVGWGLPLGGELTDLMLVLPTEESLSAFASTLHLGVGGSASASVGPLGRHAEAQVSVPSSTRSRTHTTPVLSYSLSRGAFIGVALETSLITIRSSVNQNFYGYPVTPRQLLLGSCVPQPPAAALLYDGLHTLMHKFENRGRLVHGAGGVRPSSSSSHR